MKEEKLLLVRRWDNQIMYCLLLDEAILKVKMDGSLKLNVRHHQKMPLTSDYYDGVTIKMPHDDDGSHYSSPIAVGYGMMLTVSPSEKYCLVWGQT